MSDSELATLAHDYLMALYAYQPAFAVMLGRHEYDGHVADPSATTRSARIAALQGFRDRLAQIDATTLSGTEHFDYDLLQVDCAAKLYDLQELKAYEWNPLSYVDALDTSHYIIRDYAPLPDRVRAVTRLLDGTPDFLAAVLKNLRPDLPRVPLQTAIDAFEGNIAYLNDDLRHAMDGVSDAAILRAFDTARERATVAMQGFVTALRDRLPGAAATYALGRNSFERMLRSTELIDMPLDRVLAIGETDLHRNEEMLAEAARHIDPHGDVASVMRAMRRSHPDGDHLIAETEGLLESIRSFLIEHDIVTLPSEVRCTVAEMPRFMRWATAAMSPPGPFERTATAAYYYVTPPEPDWSPERRDEWLGEFAYAMLRNISVHEAYPGHYVQFLHLQNAPTDLAKSVWSYAFVEGWAHYSEQMMIEEGYGADDPHVHVAQLTDALVRNCRYIAAIKLHTDEMTVDEATRFFIDHAYMDELPARKEAERGTFDPGYLNYTLGKLLYLELRDDYRREQGSAFSLRTFHDRCLAYGTPPPRLLRRYLLDGSVGS